MTDGKTYHGRALSRASAVQPTGQLPYQPADRRTNWLNHAKTDAAQLSSAKLSQRKAKLTRNTTTWLSNKKTIDQPPSRYQENPLSDRQAKENQLAT